MDNQIFCDGIGRISIIGGVVRLDLMAYSPTETDANGQPRAVLTQRVVMGVEGFLRSSEKVLEITQQITRAAPAANAPPQPAPRPPQVQPEFRRESVAPAPMPAPAPAAPPPPKRPFP